MFANLRQDLARLREIRPEWSSFRLLVDGLLLQNGFHAVFLHRLAHWFKKNNIPFCGPLVGRVSSILTGVEIGPATEIGPGLMISHGHGIVIGQWAKLGENVTLMQQVTIGATSVGKLDRMPTIGNGVFIGAGARIVGGVTVGDGALVGANAVVLEDVPAGGRALAPPAEIREASEHSSG